MYRICKIKNTLIIFLISFLLIMAVPIQGNADAQVYNDFSEWFPDEKGGFYCAGSLNGELFYKHYNHFGNIDAELSENIPVECVGYSSSRLFFISSMNNRCTLVILSGKGHSISFAYPDIPSLNTDTVTLTAEGDIVYYDPLSPDAVYFCDMNGDAYEQYEIDAKIFRLFTDPGGIVCALTDQGILHIKEGTFINSAVPSGNLTGNGHFFWDSTGKAYFYESKSGFSVLPVEAGNGMICAGDNSVYIADGTNIFSYDNDGNLTASVKLQNEPDRILSSAGNLSYLMSNALNVIDKKDFIPEKRTEEKNESSRQSSKASVSDIKQSGNNVKKEKPVIEVEQSEKTVPTLFPDEDGLIRNITPSTTVSQLKKMLCCDILQVQNHNGITVKSGTVGTGWTITVPAGKYQTVIKGDLTGEGSINSRDHDKLIRYLFADEDFSSSAIEAAADINEDFKISCSDLYMLYCGYGM